jgi:hypothetical protein
LAYKFSFDLTGLSRSFFREIAKISDERNLHRKLGNFAEHTIDTFNIKEITGLPLSDAVVLINDMVDVYAKNLSQQEAFSRSQKRALLLPHCARKYMDRRCQADFDPKISSYICQHCSPDCLVNRAWQAGLEAGYDVYVLPGGSCIPKLLSQRKYDGIVGVACPNEIQMGIREMGKSVPYQALPLLKNGCANTEFNLETLDEILDCHA